MAPLPAFHADTTSPTLPPGTSAITIVSSGDGPIGEVVLHGSYRVLEADRARLGPATIRHQIWLVAIQRKPRAVFRGRAAAEGVVFAEEEPEHGDVQGWFHVLLAPAARIPAKEFGLYDITAVLGPLRSPPLAVTLRR